MHKDILFLDTETTGVTTADEILSIAIVDADGNTLLDTYITPIRNTEWPDAQAVNGISPEFIFGGNFPMLPQLHNQLLDIVRGKIIVTYGLKFDMDMLRQNGIDIADVTTGTLCCMNRMAIWNGEPSAKRYHVTGYRNVSLSVAAELTGYEWAGPAHSALADALACRHVWQFMDANWRDPDISVL